MKFNEFKPSSRPQLTEDQIYTQNLLMDFLESKITKEEFLKQIDESVGRDQLNEILPALAGLGAAAGAAARFAPQIARGVAKYGGKAVQGIKNFFGGGPRAVAGNVGNLATGPAATAAGVGSMVPGMLKKVGKGVGKVAVPAALGAGVAMALDNEPDQNQRVIGVPDPDPYATNADPKMPKGWDKDKKKDDGPSDFGAAFAAARKKQGGPGGKFTWQGKEYQTNVKGEKYVTNPVSVDKATAANTGDTAANTGDYDKTLALQKKLIAQGANIKADGLMGPNTRAAMKAAGMATTTPGSKVKTPGPSVTQNPAYSQTGMDDVDMPQPKPKATGTGMKSTTTPGSKVKTPGPSVTQNPAYNQTGMGDNDMDDNAGGVAKPKPKGGKTIKTPFGFSYETLPDDDLAALGLSDRN